MRCPACQHESPAQAKYCSECGTRLLGGKPGPAAYTPDHLAQRILSSRGALEGERKQVTVLFADLKGSMELLADRDPEDARAILDPVLERMMEAVHHYEGTVNQVLGDGIMALFGAPLAHEDHAVRACYAALRMQEAVQRLAGELRGRADVPIAIRVGLNSGEVVVRAIGSDLHMDYTAVGQTTHLAARMEQTAQPGTILITPQTLQLVDGYVAVRARGPTPIKGLAEPLPLYEVVGAGPLRTRLQAAAARGLTRFVGRGPEMTVLHRELARAGAGQGRLVALVGDPGVGKSRLVHELAQHEAARGWRVLAGSSVSYGRAAAYRPVVEVLRAYFKVDRHADVETVRRVVADAAAGLGPASRSSMPALLSLLGVPVEEAGWQALDPAQRRRLTLDTCQRLLLRATQEQPLLLVFEDLHWIDSETQALLDSLVDSLSGARLLLLLTYRPEYQHRWGNTPDVTELRLAPLQADGTAALLEALLGDDGELAPLKRLLRERTDGNPFFLEESVRTLVETGGLVGERGAYRPGDAVESTQVPATVQAILAARIDRLAPDDKRLLQAAAVIGKEVPAAVLQAVADAPGAAVRDGLARLCAADFLDESGGVPGTQYRFMHALTHEVAYQGLLVGRRTELHGRAAVALEAQYGEGTQHLAELEALGLHFSLSAEPLRGARYFLAAGDRARTIYANADAARHYQRAVDLFATEDATRAEEQLARERLADVLALVGQREAAQAEYAVVLAAHAADGDGPAQARLQRKLGGLCWAAGDRERALTHYGAGLALLAAGPAHIEQAQLYQELGRLAFRGGDCTQAIAWARRALALAEGLAASAGDDQTEVAAAMAHAYNTLGIALARTGDAAAAVAHIERSLTVAQQHELLQVACRAYTNLSVVYSTLDPGQAITTCLAGLELAQKIGDLGLQPWLYANLASAYCTFTGQCEAEGIAAARAAIALDRQLGQVDHLAVPLVVLGQIYQCHGDPARALQYYDEAMRIAEEMQEPQLLFPCYDGLATLYLEQGDVARAEHYMLQAREVCERAGLEPDSLLVLPFLG